MMKSFVLLGAATAALGSSLALDAPTYRLNLTPSSPVSKPHTPQFVSYSFEPAFWTEFFGEPDSPRNLTFTLLNHLHSRGARPIIRPGGITMDSMIYDPKQRLSVVRTENGKGGIYRTTVGPAFYKQWDNFPPGTSFVSTLNFGNNSLPTARDLAVASASFQGSKIIYYELGNEPTNYPAARFSRSTANYVSQWLSFTSSISSSLLSSSSSSSSSAIQKKPLFWASSATTDKTDLHVRPSDLIPAGINRTGLVGQYSIHSYAFATCDPRRNELATIPNILNHTALKHYADVEIYPSAKAALEVGAEWTIGEFNSIACSGKPGVSDTFAQALWTLDVSLLYAVRNSSSVHLHQGATLAFQSDQQLNTPGDDGTPGFSSYSLLYPVNSTKRGEARVLPVFVSQLLIVEALRDGGRVAELQNGGGGGGGSGGGLKKEEWSGYVIDAKGGTEKRVVLLNMKPFYAGQKEKRGEVWVEIDEELLLSKNGGGAKVAEVKRMTAPSVDEKDASKVTWAGQSFRDAVAVGEVVVERVEKGGKVLVRDSEAVLVTLR